MIVFVLLVFSVLVFQVKSDEVSSEMLQPRGCAKAVTIISLQFDRRL